jgi:hypothetical protein
MNIEPIKHLLSPHHIQAFNMGVNREAYLYACDGMAEVYDLTHMYPIGEMPAEALAKYHAAQAVKWYCLGGAEDSFCKESYADALRADAEAKAAA